jgi:hypothetical protein
MILNMDFFKPQRKCKALSSNPSSTKKKRKEKEKSQRLEFSSRVFA